MINNAVDFMCSSPGAGERLDVGRGLSHSECSNKHDEEHLETHTHTHTHIGVSSTNPRFHSHPYAEREKIMRFCHNASTHGEYSSDGVLPTQDERAPVPEGQSIGQVDHQEGEAHGKVRRDRLLYSHCLSILQVLIISVVQHTNTDATMSVSSMESEVRVKYISDYKDNGALWHRQMSHQ